MKPIIISSDQIALYELKLTNRRKAATFFQAENTKYI